MIASLRGNIIHRTTDRIVVEAGGVGYEVAISLGCLESLPPNGEIFLHIHTEMRENAIELYGFSNTDEKAMFRLLLSISGIGPRIALNTLSGISPEGFRRAILERDVRKLTSIPGIGKKSAERIILELKEKIQKIPASESAFSAGPTSASLEEDLISSLMNLGYREKAAEEVAKSVAGRADGSLTISQAIRMALKELTPS